MAKLSKRRQAFQQKVAIAKQYPFEEAINLVKECATVKFTERVDVAIRLGVDARKSDQAVRGATVLPNGLGKAVRIAVFAQGENADKARAAGADTVGFEDLAERIKLKKEKIDFDVVIATPDAMRIVGQLGQILGPCGLMPNPKVGTVATDVEEAIKNVSSGVRYRTDKNGIVHCTVGNVKFDNSALQQNVEVLLLDLKKIKPASAKGTYLKKLVVSSTMGPGILVDLASLNI